MMILPSILFGLIIFFALINVIGAASENISAGSQDFCRDRGYDKYNEYSLSTKQVECKRGGRRMDEDYLRDVRTQARMLLDPNISSDEYQEFKLKRLKKHKIIESSVKEEQK